MTSPCFTLSPFRSSRNLLRNPSVLRNVKRLQRKTSTTVAVETFGNAKRIITPGETIEFKLPMVLDTSHLFASGIFQVIEAYHSGTVGVHLSEMRYDDAAGHDLPHLPVASYGIEALRAKSWDGNVTLEYLPPFHDRLIPDRRKVYFNTKEEDDALLEME